jgi:hypothetical protein
MLKNFIPIALVYTQFTFNIMLKCLHLLKKYLLLEKSFATHCGLYIISSPKIFFHKPMEGERRLISESK